jgi:hypothetical protein
MSHNIAAPDRTRIVVKLAASICACLSAKRHNSELAANAVMANMARMASCCFFIASFIDMSKGYPVVILVRKTSQETGSCIACRALTISGKA